MEENEEQKLVITTETLSIWFDLQRKLMPVVIPKFNLQKKNSRVFFNKKLFLRELYYLFEEISFRNTYHLINQNHCGKRP